ncbi:tRNA pseudouridine55 synthase [Natranaerovirga pectinivora]|uniref:tRNA pseudouridine synthase B n=1 Tax=Natranaerovirga pectinivora TaxID=682400 RepID=A0A4R3MR43_9FIRM|nr:tRNA pseudouridine(55) synthase TruB [Natranaerovirga pectinivora]TCT15048.1 tRNA pseudouridine55 synthase [Natranaerovirga pectinivora]
MINGIINVYKEKGYTSHDVVAKLRRILNQRKIGHTGTLDPEAEGVLPICLGKGTKVSGLLTDTDKVYEAVLKLGITTDTQDHTGRILEEKAIEVTQEQIEEVIKSFIGEYHQIPPMYSALKVKGKKLYELAREGIEIERKSRTIFIHYINVLDIKPSEIKMVVKCSKGTYIRTLCHDIGQKLGCGGHMMALKRTEVGIFNVDQSITLDQIDILMSNNELEDYIYPVQDLFKEYNSTIVKEDQYKYLYNGNKLDIHKLNLTITMEPDEIIRVYDENNQFIGLYQYIVDEKVLKPIKIFL